MHHLRLNLSYSKCVGTVACEAPYMCATIYRNNISITEYILVRWDPMYHMIIDRGTNASGETTITEECRSSTMIANEFISDTIQILCRHPRLNVLSHLT